jgi:hypothetical protein
MAAWIEIYACQGHAALCEFGGLSNEQAAEMLSQLNSTQTRFSYATAFDQAERIGSLQMFTRLVQSGCADAEFYQFYDLFEDRGGPAIADHLRKMIAEGSEIDWDEGLRFINQWHNRVRAGFETINPAEPGEWTAALQEESDELARLCARSDSVIARLTEGSPAERGRIVGEIVLSVSDWDLDTFATVEAVMRTRRQLAGLAYRLAAYRAEHAAYPEKLADVLQPAEAHSAILDPFTGQQFIYRLQDGGFMCYSLGPNHRDDGGINHGPESGLDDPCIRVPSEPE